MSGLIESAAAILGASERRLETVSSNVSNISTAGYKRQVNFNDLVLAGADSTRGSPSIHSDFSQGTTTRSGNPLDLAISGDGFFQVRAGSALLYSRDGRFSLAEDGSVVTPQGYVLQQSGGGDLVVNHGSALKIQEDGTVLDGGIPVGKIAIFVAAEAKQMHAMGGSLFSAPEGAMEDARGSMLRQGMIEASNVTLAEEMVAMMTSVREGESGARLVQVYDDLMGKAISTFGEGGR